MQGSKSFPVWQPATHGDNSQVVPTVRRSAKRNAHDGDPQKQQDADLAKLVNSRGVDSRPSKPRQTLQWTAELLQVQTSPPGFLITERRRLMAPQTEADGAKTGILFFILDRLRPVAVAVPHLAQAAFGNTAPGGFTTCTRAVERRPRSRNVATETVARTRNRQQPTTVGATVALGTVR